MSLRCRCIAATRNSERRSRFSARARPETERTARSRWRASTVLRRAFNVVAGADARYVWYRFDPPPSGLPLEGIAGGGDSGGPAIIEHEDLQQLAGLTSWNKYRPSNDHAFHPGLYGQIVYNVRISRYIQWIESVMSASKACDALQRTHLPCADRQHP
jgi:hypothetical protein